jgi:hypothetical protein
MAWQAPLVKFAAGCIFVQVAPESKHFLMPA